MTSAPEAIAATVAALERVRAAEFEYERLNARLSEFARPVLDGLGVAFAKVGHPEHKHMGGRYWAMGERDRLRGLPGAGGGQGMSTQTKICFTWVDEVQPDGVGQALGQPLYEAFWDKERAVRLLCEAQADFATVWERNIGPLPQRPQ